MISEDAESVSQVLALLAHAPFSHCLQPEVSSGTASVSASGKSTTWQFQASQYSLEVLGQLFKLCNVHLQVLLDPQAAAKSKLQKQARRAKGRKRKMEELARMRSAGAPVKNKKVRRKAVE